MKFINPLMRKHIQELMPILEKMKNIVNSSPIEYRKYAKHLNRTSVSIQYTFYVTFMQSFLPKNSHILDWGGQYGHVTKLLNTHFPNVDCYLPNRNEYKAEYYHDKFSIDKVTYGLGDKDYKRINFGDSTFDAVISSGVLEHTHEFNVSNQESLQELNRVLKSGGYLFIWHLPTKLGFPELVNATLGRWHHDRRYNKKEINKLIKESGFELVMIDKHEFMNYKMRSVLAKMIGNYNAYKFDYYFSKLPIINFFAQHFTIVARKLVK